MAEIDTPQLVTSVLEATEVLTLASVSFYRQSASRDDIDMSDQELSEEEGASEMRTAFRAGAEGIDYRACMEIGFANAQIEVDAVVSFRSTKPIEMTPEVVYEFGDTVAMMTLYPYMRQAITDLGNRIGLGTSLPLIRPGDVSFRPNEISLPTA